MNTIDRLQQQLDALTREVDGLRRRRDALPGRPYDVRSAITFESSDSERPYPREATAESTVPIRFWEPGDTGRRYHSLDVACDAYLPIGWLPPDTDIDVALQPDGQWRIIRWPAVFQAYAPTQIPAATWGTYYACNELTPGVGAVQFWRKSGSLYVPQTYRDATAVTVDATNTTGAPVDAKKLLTVEVNADGDWVVTVEPCSDPCE